MAFIKNFNPSDDQSEVTGQQQGISATPTITSSSGDVSNAQTMGSAIVNPNAQTPQSSGFTNIQKYLNANTTGGANLGNQITSQLESSKQAAETNMQNAANEFTNKVQQGTHIWNPDVNNPKESTYTGPTTFGDSPIAAQALKDLYIAQQKANLATTSGGRQQLIRDLTPNITTGGTNLNEFLLSNSPQIGNINATAEKIKPLQTTFNAQATSLQNQANAAQNQVNTANYNLADMQAKAQVKAAQDRQAASEAAARAQQEAYARQLAAQQAAAQQAAQQAAAQAAAQQAAQNQPPANVPTDAEFSALQTRTQQLWDAYANSPDYGNPNAASYAAFKEARKAQYDAQEAMAKAKAIQSAQNGGYTNWENFWGEKPGTTLASMTGDTSFGDPAALLAAQAEQAANPNVQMVGGPVDYNKALTDLLAAQAAKGAGQITPTTPTGQFATTPAPTTGTYPSNGGTGVKPITLPAPVANTTNFGTGAGNTVVGGGATNTTVTPAPTSTAPTATNVTTPKKPIVGMQYQGGGGDGASGSSGSSGAGTSGGGGIGSVGIGSIGPTSIGASIGNAATGANSGTSANSGATVGAAIGAAIGGPVAATIGAAIGQAIGNSIGASNASAADAAAAASEGDTEGSTSGSNSGANTSGPTGSGGQAAAAGAAAAAAAAASGADAAAQGAAAQGAADAATADSAAADADADADADGGAGGSSKIICTAMNDAYGLPYRENQIWVRYAKLHLKPEHQIGYHKVFLPLVDYAYKQKNGYLNLKVRKVLEWIAINRTADIKAELKGAKRNPLHKLLRNISEPALYWIGKWSKK